MMVAPSGISATAFSNVMVCILVPSRKVKLRLLRQPAAVNRQRGAADLRRRVGA
jgi:hypothetical protein